MKTCILLLCLVGCSSEMVSDHAVAADASASADAGSIDTSVDIQVANLPTCTTQTCDDVNLCTIDSCQGGQCHHEPVFCGHEGDAGGQCCQIFFCETETGLCKSKQDPTCDGCGGGSDETCAKDADCAPSGNLCLPSFCQYGYCMYRGIDCDDGDPCTNDACKKEIGCLNQPISGCVPKCTSTSCDDNNPCTTDKCEYQGCKHEDIFGFTKTCEDDGDPCTTEECEYNDGNNVCNSVPIVGCKP